MREFDGGKQKDWIIYNRGGPSLWCLAIADEGDGWKLIEWVNFPILPAKKLDEMVRMGYHTMLQAAMGRDKYEYVIADYRFSPKDIETRYWKSLVPTKFTGKKSVSVPISLSQFNNHVGKLVLADHVRFSG